MFSLLMMSFPFIHSLHTFIEQLPVTRHHSVMVTLKMQQLKGKASLPLLGLAAFTSPN